MTPAFQKTLGLLLLILLGFFLQKKVASKDQLKGIKVLILSVALPATIFVALLKINLASNLLFLPVMALVFNGILLGTSHLALGAFGIKRNTSTRKTLLMLLPSLAPGLSCFPFLIEFLGEEELAMAALADVGNKIFVLIILYIIAINWYHSQFSKDSDDGKSKGKLKSLLLSMLNEPINMVIISALLLLALGFNLSSFPVFVENTILRISALMTPLVLLFIGLSVKIKWKELHLIFFLLSWRAGITFCLSALVIMALPAMTPALILLLVVFPQSSCSFWPFAHMSAINGMEKNQHAVNKTFNTDFALSILACSLPFSTLIILSVFTFQSFFINPFYVGITGIVLLSVSLIPVIITKLGKSKVSEDSLEHGSSLARLVNDIESKQAS